VGKFFVAIAVLFCSNAQAEKFADVNKKRFALGFGTALVSFDSKIKLTNLIFLLLIHANG